MEISHDKILDLRLSRLTNTKLTFFMAGLNATVLGFLITHSFLGNLEHLKFEVQIAFFAFSLCLIFCVVNIWRCGHCIEECAPYYDELTYISQSRNKLKEELHFFVSMAIANSEKGVGKMFDNFEAYEKKTNEIIDNRSKELEKMKTKIDNSWNTKILNWSYCLVIAAHFVVYIGSAVLVPSYVIGKEKTEYCEVNRIVDGDTIEIFTPDGIKNKVRMIGIDTPELHESHKLDKDIERTGKDKATIQALGQKSSDYVKSFLHGKKVRLEYGQEKQDKYGRILAYLFLEDGTFVNKKIIHDGYAHAYTRFPFKYMDDFVSEEKQAREAKRGLWSDENADY